VTKVLYVEHNDDNLYMLKTRLELRGGFKVLAAEDSEKAAGWPRPSTEGPAPPFACFNKFRHHSTLALGVSAAVAGSHSLFTMQS
jgi:hypothetical protein